MAQSSDKCHFICALGREVSISAAHLIFWPVFIIGLIADLVSKSVVFKWISGLAPQRYGVIDGFFQFVLVENRGAAWGMASGKTMSLIVVSVVAIIMVFFIFLSTRKLQMVVVIALGLFAAGICGNLYDRIFNEGKVRDFLDFYHGDWHFPAFNLADSMLTVAVALLILVTIFSPTSKTENTESNSDSNI